MLTPNPALPSVAWGRVGIGVNGGHLRKAGGFVGLGFGPPAYWDGAPDYSSATVFVGELRVPVGGHLMAQVHGLVGRGEKFSQWGFGTGLQYDFGSRH